MPDPLHVPNVKESEVLNFGPELDFLKLIWAVDHGLQRLSKRMADSLGITGPQRLVIRVVGKYPRISAGRLASVLCIHPSTLTGILKRLESRGIISRTADDNDGRRCLLELSEQGGIYNTAVEGTPESSIHKLLAQFPPDQIAAAKEVLGALPFVFDQVLAICKPKLRPTGPRRRVRDAPAATAVAAT